jgi:diguanylate cyclase (GGDEF)-like protein
MKENLLAQIVTVCLKMDRYAVKIYQKLSQTAKDEELGKFWNKMSLEESKHVACWGDLLPLVEEGIIPPIFTHPEIILKELNANYDKIIAISKKSITSTDLSENFFLAFRLEFYLLHPALERLWHFYGILQKQEYNPENEYENHIQQFISAMEKFGAGTIELEVLAETVVRMWHQTKNMVQEANFDELTGILNRRGYFQAMTSLASLAKRNKFNSAVLMIDIDHFKQINDTLGHLTGDEVLKQIANIIKTNLRASDILGRFGGEEFIVFLPQIEGNSLYTLSEKIRTAIQEETKQKIAVTVSIGGATKKITGEIEIENRDLIQLADKNMYKAKRKGRNQVVC